MIWGKTRLSWYFKMNTMGKRAAELVAIKELLSTTAIKEQFTESCLRLTLTPRY